MGLSCSVCVGEGSFSAAWPSPVSLFCHFIVTYRTIQQDQVTLCWSLLPFHAAILVLKKNNKKNLTSLLCFGLHFSIFFACCFRWRPSWTHVSILPFVSFLLLRLKMLLNELSLKWTGLDKLLLQDFKEHTGRNFPILVQITHCEMMVFVVFVSIKEKRIQPTTTKTRTSVRGTRTEQPACWVSIQLLRNGRLIISVCALVAANHNVRKHMSMTEKQNCFLCLYRFHRNCIDHMKVKKKGIHTSC